MPTVAQVWVSKCRRIQPVFSIPTEDTHCQLLDETSSYVVSIICHDERIPGCNLSPEINS